MNILEKVQGTNSTEVDAIVFDLWADFELSSDMHMRPIPQCNTFACSARDPIILVVIAENNDT